MDLGVVLIGMSGAGKTTAGRVLANTYGVRFVDTDEIIQTQSGSSLEELVLKDEKAFLRTEEKTLLSLGLNDNPVVATGGSAIYSPKAMKYLRNNAYVVFLDVPLPILTKRVKPEGRGIVGLGRKTYAELAKERHVLYQLFSDFTLRVEEGTPEETAKAIARVFSKPSKSRV